MFETFMDGQMSALIGVGGGTVLGLAARMGRFCTLGAIEDKLYGEDDTRFRMWGIALGTALILVYGLSAFGMFDPNDSVYFRAPFSPVAAVLGGLTFGYGMALSGNCGFGALARLGGGDLRSFVIVLVLGITSLVALTGPIAGFRLWFVDLTAVDLPWRGYPQAISAFIGVPAAFVGILVGAVFVFLTLRAPKTRKAHKEIFWAAMVGIAVAGAWLSTSWISTHGFDQIVVESYTYAAPIGETLIYLMTASAGGINFGIGSVAGVLLGAFVGSLFKGHFRWEACEDPRELRRQIMGAATMGIGAAFALGCSIGQGISAMSVLSLSAPLVVVSIIAGAALGLRQIMFGLTWLR